MSNYQVGALADKAVTKGLEHIVFMSEVSLSRKPAKENYIYIYINSYFSEAENLYCEIQTFTSYKLIMNVFDDGMVGWPQI